MSWRTDVENMPKNGKPLLVIDNGWRDRQPCIYTFNCVSWTNLNANSDEEDLTLEYGWAYDYNYNYEYGYYHCVKNPAHWLELTFNIMMNDVYNDVYYNVRANGKLIYSSSLKWKAE